MPHQIPLAKNTSTNKFQELKVDANGKLEVSDSVVNVNTDGLETLVGASNTLLTAGNNTLSSIDNKVILPSVLDSDRLKVYDSAVIGSLSTINNNIDGLETLIGLTNTKLDTIDGSINPIEGCVSGSELQVDIVSGTVSVSGVSTEAKQDTIIGHIDGVEGLIGDTNNKIDAMRGSNSITDLATKLNAGLPSALSSDRLKCVLDANLADTNNKLDSVITAVELLDNTVSGNELQCDIVSSALPSGASTLAKQNEVITELTSIKTAVEILDNVVSGSEIQADIVSSALPSGASTSANQSTMVSHLSDIKTAVELLDNAISGSELQVDIVSSALPSGGATSANQSTIAGHLNDIKTAVEILDNAVSGNELQCDIVSSALPSGASTATHQTTIIGHLDGVEGLIGTTNTNLGTIETDIEATNTKLGTIETDIEATNTALATIDSVLDNILVKNGEIETTCDAVLAKNTEIEDSLNSILSKNTEIDTAVDAMSAKLPASLGQKANASSLSICRSTTAGAFDLSARTTIGTASTSTKLLCDSDGHLQVDVLSGASGDPSAPSAIFTNSATTIANGATFDSGEITLTSGKKVGVLINTNTIDPQSSAKVLVGFSGDADQQLIGSSGSSVVLPLAQIDGSGDYHATGVIDCPFPTLKITLENNASASATISNFICKVFQ